MLNFAMFYSMLTTTGTSVLDAMMGIWTAIQTWIISSINSVSALFYAPGTGLTLLGTLAIAGLGVGICFLLIGVVSKFFKFKG